MQSDLADAGGQLFSPMQSNHVDIAAKPDKSSQAAFENASKQVQAVDDIPENTLSVSTTARDNGRPNAAAWAQHSTESLDSSHWAIRQNIVDVTPMKRSKVEDVLGFGQELSSIRTEAMKKLIQTDDVFAPLLDFQNKLQEQGANQGIQIKENMTQAESMAFLRDSFERNNIANAELQRITAEISAEMNRRKVTFSVTVASYSWVKEMMSGAVKMVKNVISNIR